jgi:hypothetical protein
MVFQLKRPEYEMLRRWGSLVKSTVLVSASKPAKYSSKGRVSRDSVEKSKPLGVRWYLISLV